MCRLLFIMGSASDWKNVFVQELLHSLIKACIETNRNEICENYRKKKSRDGG